MILQTFVKSRGEAGDFLKLVREVGNAAISQLAGNFR
jgi:hypothetical protein